MDALSGLFAFLFAFLAGIIVIAIVIYILMAIALMKLGKREGITWSWVAWIPLGNLVLLAKIAWNNKAMQVALPILTFVSNSGDKITYDDVTEKMVTTAGTFPGWVASLAGLAYFVLSLMSYHRVYKKYSTNYVVMTVFTCLTLGFTAPFMLFAIRNNEQISA